jgi:demethylmenaquinone methyltransferase/2-methoxy-6-polyprenyl-1,4-benzoquinol methylase
LKGEQMRADEVDRLLQEQQDYYRARAPDYFKEALVPLSSQKAATLRRDLEAVFDRHFRGDVLELACGPGTWTATLAERARSVIAVDGSAEMLTLAARRTPGGHVRFLQADLFEWRPQRGYDAVFFGFWLSHVPDVRFESFWSAVAGALRPGGHVVFVDDALRSEEELVYGADSPVVQRVLSDGSRHRVVKMPHTPRALQGRLARLGWDFEMHDAAPFFWGLGRHR